MSTPPTRRPRSTISNTRLLAQAKLERNAEAALGTRIADPRSRYIRLLQAWVECLPHQPAKRGFVEGALARARAQALALRTP